MYDSERVSANHRLCPIITLTITCCNSRSVYFSFRHWSFIKTIMLPMYQLPCFSNCRRCLVLLLSYFLSDEIAVFANLLAFTGNSLLCPKRFSCVLSRVVILQWFPMAGGILINSFWRVQGWKYPYIKVVSLNYGSDEMECSDLLRGRIRKETKCRYILTSMYIQDKLVLPCRHILWTQVRVSKNNFRCTK